MGRVIRFFLDERNHQSSTLNLIVLYLALVCVHLIMSLFMRGPLILPDELGYLGHARYLAGEGVMPNMEGYPFYHVGYSFFISPAFWLSSEPQTVYRFVLAINSFLISSVFLLVYYLLKWIFLFDHKISILSSLVTCLYPPFFLHSNTTWSENAIIPLFIVPSILLYLVIKRRSLSLGIVFGFSVMFLYTVHPRALPVLAITFLYLLFLALLKVFPLRIVAASLSSFVIGLVATLVLHDYLRFLGWGGGGIPSASRVLSHFTHPSGVSQFLAGVAGQLWYLTASTYGLFLGGCFIFGLTIWQNRFSIKEITSISAETHALLFYILSSAGVFILSVLFLSSSKWKAEHLMYGRYNECFVAAFMAVALGAILAGRYDEKWKKKWILAILIGFSGLGFITSLIEVNPIDVSSLIPANVYGLFPILGTLVYKLKISFTSSVLACTLFFLLNILFLTGVFKLRRVLGVISLSSLFLIMGISQYVVLYLPQRLDALILPKVIHSMPRIKMVSYDVAYGGQREFYRYQYFLPRARLVLFNSSENEFPKSEYFISSRFSQESSKIGAQVIALEKKGDLALWVKKEDVEIR